MARQSPSRACGPRLAAFVACLVTAVASVPAWGELLRVYHVGNSVTDTINYTGLGQLATSNGDAYTYGKHMSPGIRLYMAWNNQTYSGNPIYTANGFPTYTNGLKDHEWDAVTLQPFDDFLYGSDGAIQMAKNFINHTRQNAANHDTQFYVYQRWARKNSQGQLDYNAKWNSPYVAPPIEWWNQADDTRQFYSLLVDQLNTDLPNLQKKVLMVPVGDVFAELQTRMKNNQVPGYTDITQLYTDGVHLNNVGSYVVGTTFYATMYKDNPNGLPVPAAYGSVNATLSGIIQDTVWDVVSVHPAAGVPEPTGAALIVFLGATTLMGRRRA